MEEGSDYRAARMPSAEGHGQARNAVDRILDEHPEWAELIPFARQLGVRTAVSSLGFWLLWQLEGGFEGLRRLGMPETTIWRYVKNFRDGFGAHPDDYEFPGVSIDREAHWRERGVPRALYSRDELSKRED